MGYSMKGSPANRGTIEGTSGHKKAVEDASVAKQHMWEYNTTTGDETKNKIKIESGKPDLTSDVEGPTVEEMKGKQKKKTPEELQGIIVDPGKDPSKMHKGQIKKQERLRKINQRRKEQQKVCVLHLYSIPLS